MLLWWRDSSLFSVLRDPLPGNEHVEDVVFLDVVDRLLVRHHCKVVSVALQDLVVDSKTSLHGGGVLVDCCHINALKENKVLVLWAS